MSVVQEQPEQAFVKGGLFARQGTALPKPGMEVFWGRHEAWEEQQKGVKVME